MAPRGMPPQHPSASPALLAGTAFAFQAYADTPRRRPLARESPGHARQAADGSRRTTRNEPAHHETIVGGESVRRPKRPCTKPPRSDILCIGLMRL
jgi:hypothetical protein